MHSLPATTGTHILLPVFDTARVAWGLGDAFDFGKVLRTSQAGGLPQPLASYAPVQVGTVFPVEEMAGMAQGSGDCFQPSGWELFLPGCRSLASLQRV